MPCNNIVEFEPCELIKEKEIVFYVPDTFQIINVKVCLKDVCPCSTLLVCVFVYINRKLFAKKVKKVFTGKQGFVCRNCCNKCCKLKDMTIDGFEFIIPNNNCCERKACIKAYAHYICNCNICT